MGRQKDTMLAGKGRDGKAHLRKMYFVIWGFKGDCHCANWTVLRVVTYASATNTLKL